MEMEYINTSKIYEYIGETALSTSKILPNVNTVQFHRSPDSFRLQDGVHLLTLDSMGSNDNGYFEEISTQDAEWPVVYFDPSHGGQIFTDHHTSIIILATEFHALFKSLFK